MAFENLIFLIGNFGFPIAIALWFMFRLEKILINNNQTIQNNTDILRDLKNQIKGANNKKN